MCLRPPSDTLTDQWRPIADHGLTGYASVLMRRLALFLLVLALFAPRAAWAVHVADHEPISAQSAEHVHHHGHSHEVTASGATAKPSQQDRHHEGGDTDGLAHQHPPSILMAFAALLPAVAEVAGPPQDRELVHDALSDGIRIASPKLPDRPPRTA